MFRALLPAFRLRTLPLAFSSICVGTAMAVANDVENWHPLIFILTLFTAFALQILSNIANDYGDGVKGTDSRQIQAQPHALTGRVTGKNECSQPIMRKLLFLWGGLTFLLGITLSFVATETALDFWVFLILGIVSMIASVTYTVGKRAYGYCGLGDVSVFVFFGFVGVLGSYYLQAHHFNVKTILPAIAVGALCVAVLNINNLRDMETDKESGKYTFALCIGKNRAEHYHVALIILALLSFLLGMVTTHWLAWTFLLTVPFFAHQCLRLYRAKTSESLGKELPICVKLTLITSLLYAIGQLAELF